MSFATRFIAGLGLLAAASSVLAQPLTLDTYNPRDAAVFPVSSTLITGEKDAILVDAQFSNREAEELVKRIQASGKHLTTIFISHGDPDYYFGLDVLTRAYPEAKVLATPATVAYIEKTRAPKLAYWGPILKDSAPARTLAPEVLQGDALELEGQRIEVVGHDPKHTSLWIPGIKAVVGGILTSANIHVWMADSQSAEARKSWLKSLDELEALQPTTLVPGHYLGEPAMNLADLRFTRDYLLALEEELAKANDSQALIAAMKARYPDLQDESSLELSAKVLKGEMQWP
ncbi:beta-lactamase domain-containing protein [Ectopseudomonas mendocina]|jgi:glyoxylase-like metal-dependent hydrolase (beta-lactamase superfamily II)|uniref:Beta-lactamase domain-containing protein n=2 Tax=Ectopseudomonas mendocina TaxID=300 RepID=A0A379ISJ9_ECTME|nr:MBL fold metallo-hydrolase [Pseudomonas mendocina]AEB59415.1 beta-lactamase domain-containing protein [Pseudomonas mendocina NK-01]ALN18574.1 MBL fold metallo-hydrolase [Pseudomonas mendocina S5.2]KES00575.1 beta-lactamase [Pseudomonas mendocina]TRO11392.1 MBL fold metallo-hydrolase [Pseudomonas mendocina]TRO16762.1 MBL fold metallo-hydrolase [Pseudomonas mendocina]